MADEEIIETPAVETPEAKVETPAPVDYKALYEEHQAKYKDIDLDKYNRAKEYDYDKAQKAIEYQEKMEAERLRKEQEENESDPVKKLGHELNQVKQTLAQREQAEKQKAQAEWMDKYTKTVDSSIEQALKSDFKDLEELSPAEKKLVKFTVNQAFEEDASAKVQKLNLSSVSKLVSDAVKEVKENRTFVTSRNVKKQSAPSLPTAQDGATPKTLMTDSQRITAMVDAYKKS